MKKTITFFRLLPIVLIALFLLGNGVKIYSASILTDNCSAATSGWTFTNSVTAQAIQQTGYWLLQASNSSTKDVIISDNINVSNYTGLVLTFDLATYGSGTNNPALVEYSTDGGNTWSTNTFTTATPTSSTYVTSGNLTLGTLNTSTLKLRFTNKGTADKGVRMKNISLTGTLSSNATITLNPSTLTGFTYSQGLGPSTEKTFTVSGVNLTSDITITSSTNYEISKSSGAGYTSPLTFPQSSGTVSETTVYVRLKSGLSTGNYNLEAISANSTGATSMSVLCSGSVTSPAKPEPTNHATSFTATTNSSSQITVTWTDATGAQVPDGYLVKASTSTPSAPTDGNAETGTLIQNIAQGTQTAVFTGLSASTTYNFSIWPYTNTGAAIDYKTDGSVPTASATTSAALLPTVLQAGDIAILQLNSTNPDRFAFITFVDLNPNTIINFTDNGFNSSTAVRTGEGFLTYTAPSTITAGTVISWYNGMSITGTGWNSSAPTNFALASPDQLFAYQGTWDNTQTLIYGISTTPWISTGTTTSNNSYLPNGLLDNINAFGFATSTSNAYYSGLTSGTVNALKSLISNSFNWTSSSTDQGAQSWTFTFSNSTSLNIDASVKNLTIASGETFTLQAGKQLTVSGTLTNNGTLNLLSTAGGTATLTAGSTSGTGTTNVSQYLSSARNWYLSSPVTAAAAPAGFTYYQRDEAGASWTSQPFVAGNTFKRGKGYIALPGAAGSTLTFSGQLNVADTTVALSWSGSASKGFNLIGNPYPCHLTWTKAFTDANASLIESSIYYRTNSGTVNNSGQWSNPTYNAFSGASVGGATGVIPPMQAVWVRAIAAGNLVLDNNLTRSHQSSNPMKAPAVATSQNLRLVVSDGSSSDEMLVYFNANASNAYDAYDSPKMINGSTSLVPDMYTMVGNEELVINGMSTIPSEIPLYIKPNASTSGQFSLTATEVSNFEAGTLVYIKDNKTGDQQLISDGSVYKFDVTTEPSLSIIIKAPGAVTGLGNNPDHTTMNVYANAKGQITVVLPSVKEGDVARVYNSAGQCILNQTLTITCTMMNKFFTAGVYVVKVNDTIRKVVIE